MCLPHLLGGHMNTKGVYMHNSDEWSTPQDFFDELDARYHFTLDPCSTDENAKCIKHYTNKENGLNKSWKNEIVFCNPPYSNIKLWAEKCAFESQTNNATIVLLIPARTDTAYFHDYILPFCKLVFIRGRLKFGDSKNSAPFPSVLCIFNERINNG